jgi:hypothetical protein
MDEIVECGMRVGGFVHNALRLGFAALAVVAMTYQFSALDNTLPTFSHGNFFSFFTIQSNILGAAALALAAIVRRSERNALFDALRGAATLYMAITGIVFALLLSGLQEELDTHIAWVDFTVHKLMPVVLVVDWLLEPARRRLPLWTAGAWLAYPVAWFAYTLVRGASEDWYPYPFVDVQSHGYGRVLLNAAVMAVCFAVGALVFPFVGNRRAGPNPVSSEPAPEAA